MDSKERLYEITAYTENSVGLLSSIAGMFTRRGINIEKLLVYPSHVKGVHKFKIFSRTTPQLAEQVVLQMEKKVDVIKAFYREDNERSRYEVEVVSDFLRNRENNNN